MKKLLTSLTVATAFTLAGCKDKAETPGAQTLNIEKTAPAVAKSSPADTAKDKDQDQQKLDNMIQYYKNIKSPTEDELALIQALKETKAFLKETNDPEELKLLRDVIQMSEDVTKTHQESAAQAEFFKNLDEFKERVEDKLSRDTDSHNEFHQSIQEYVNQTDTLIP